MAQEYQFVCDGCGEVVHGKRGGQFFHRDYVQFKGSITLQGYNQKTRERTFSYFTRPNINNERTEKQWLGEELSFCVKQGFPCIEKYIDRRRNEIEYMRNQKRTEHLREIRNQEIEAEERHKQIHGY